MASHSFLSRTGSMFDVCGVFSGLPVRRTFAGLCLLTSAACHGLLDVSDPTLVRDADVANANGAAARRLNVLGYLNANVPNAAESVARITDEWMMDGPSYFTGDFLDQRDSEGYETSLGTSDVYLGLLDRVYFSTSIAIPAVRAYTPDSLRGDFLAQLYAVRGYVALQAAETVCPGFPLNDVSADNGPLFSVPLTTDSAFVLASAQLDSAMNYVHDSTRVATLALVAKGRVLLDQGKYAEAATAVHAVATDAVYATDGYNGIYNDVLAFDWNDGGINTVTGERKGGNGMPFASAQDPRTPNRLGGASAMNPADTLYFSTKYTDASSPMPLATGIEARLVEAEAALHAGDDSWLTILNTLRATAISPALPDLVDPGTAAARVDLLYRERAFWLYLTGRRLGDLRRLIRNYGRDPETVFPTGDYPFGGTYGHATAIPFVLAGQQQSNPHIVTGCTTR